VFEKNAYLACFEKMHIFDGFCTLLSPLLFKSRRRLDAGYKHGSIN